MLTRLLPRLVPLALFVLAPSALAQNYKPAAEFQSLLNVRFYEADGGFLFDGIQLVFPPQGVRRASVVLSRAGGAEVASVPLRVEPFGEFPAFASLVPDGVPGVVKVGQPGDYVISIKLNGETVSTLPFSMREDKSADPFNPKRSFTREGAWRDLGFLSARVDDVDAKLTFNWWMSLRELPAGIRNPLCTVHVVQGAQEIATSYNAIVPSDDDWQFMKRELVEAKTMPKTTRQYLTRASLASRDGEYGVVVKVNGQPVKSYGLRVRGGQIQPLDRSSLAYEPHTDFISPRMIDTSAGTSSRYHMLETYWLRKSAR